MQHIDLSQVIGLDFSRIVLAAPRGKALHKAVIRPVAIKGQQVFQAEEFRGSQAFHKNLSASQAISYIESMAAQFKEIYVFCNGFELHGRFGAGGKIKFSRHETTTTTTAHKTATAHNRQKRYILPENTFVPPLHLLGIMDENGRVYAKHRDKYVQINSFLGLLDTVVDAFKPTAKLKIVDFCCGKSYLTFILYYYFKHVKKLEFQIIGIDLKADVIRKCEDTKKKLGYDDMVFVSSDIEKYDCSAGCDIAISLHACDTATDVIIKKAARAGAKAILAAPCCHKQLAAQASDKELQFILKYPALKQRFAAMLTDAVRAAWLENMGYKVDVCEFVDFENSPKNLMIRAIMKGRPADKNDLAAIAQRFSITPEIMS